MRRTRNPAGLREMPKARPMPNKARPRHPLHRFLSDKQLHSLQPAGRPAECCGKVAIYPREVQPMLPFVNTQIASEGTLRIMRKNSFIEGHRRPTSGSMQAWMARASWG